MKLKAIICFIKGQHDIDRDESIINSPIMDNRNWLCKCKRCGYYLIHDGAISGLTILLNEKEAYQIKNDFENDITRILNISKGEDEQNG